MAAQLQNAIRQIPQTDKLESDHDELKKLLAGAFPSATLDKAHLDALKDNQAQLDASYSKLMDEIGDMSGRLGRIALALTALTAPGDELSCSIEDPAKDRRDVETVTWTLNANIPLFDSLTALTNPDKLPDQFSSSLALVRKAPQLNAIASIQVTFEQTPRMEISSGVLFPALPYHSYKVGTNAQGTSTVIKVPQWAVMPAAVVSFRIGPERAFHGGRFATLFSFAGGYNTATSSAGGGFGPSFAFGSAVVNLLAVVAQDTRLTGGFAAGQTVSSKDVTPATHTVWSFKPSIGVSLRLPLGGSSK